MDRRQFLGTVAVLGTALAAGCRDMLTGPTESRKVRLAPPDDGGGGGDNRHIALYITAEGVTRVYYVPWQSGLTVRQALDWAHNHPTNPLDVVYDWDDAQGTYVSKLDGHDVFIHEPFNWYYALASQPMLTEQAWLDGFSTRGVDTQLAPPIGGAIDWRLRVA